MNSTDRSNPTPYSGDKVANPMAHQTVSTQYNPEGETSTARVQQIGKSIIANDGASKRAIFGYNSTTDTWGIFGVPIGKDVLTADLADYSFSTDYTSLFSFLGPIFPVLTYTGGTGSKVWSGADAVPPPTIPFTSISSTPSPHIYLTDIDGTVTNIHRVLPYTEYDAAGHMKLDIRADIASGPSYWTPFITITIPSTSSYYAGNHTFSFTVRITNI
jgi:hypothetical protein